MGLKRKRPGNDSGVMTIFTRSLLGGIHPQGEKREHVDEIVWESVGKWEEDPIL